MRNEHKKRLRHKRKQCSTKRSITELKCKLEAAQEKVAESELKIVNLKRMSRTFWERWKWELEKRKEAVMMSKHDPGTTQQTNIYLQEISYSMLTNPLVNGEQRKYYLGRGSFGVVRLQ